jgi:hypothetical protein
LERAMDLRAARGPQDGWNGGAATPVFVEVASVAKI